METVTKKNISKYIRLSKLRIVELLLITTVPSMIVSIYGFPPLELIVFTLLVKKVLMFIRLPLG